MKLIASDLDGTLLNEKGEISQENIHAIKKAMSKDIKFVVATGRPYSSASKLLHRAGLICPIIALNGATTFNQDKKLVRSVPLDMSAVREIHSICHDLNLYMELLTNRGGYAISHTNTMDVFVEILKTTFINTSEQEIRQAAEQRFKDEQINFIRDFNEIMTINQIEVYKMLCFSLEKEKLELVASRLNNKTGIIITSSDTTNLEFNHPNAQKGIALEWLTKAMSINMKDVMAIGDNLNDKSMLEKAGRGVAMGNALTEIKNLCDYTTATNNSNGVAVAIEEMLQEN